jgi:hypothetical protein
LFRLRVAPHLNPFKLVANAEQGLSQFDEFLVLREFLKRHGGVFALANIVAFTAALGKGRCSIKSTSPLPGKESASHRWLKYEEGGSHDGPG